MTEIAFRSEALGNAPLVTVAMPIYNAGAYLRQAVESIISQTFKDWELLVIDDGSTDNALDSIADMQDLRIRILKDGKNLGLAVRLNQAIDLANGRYFARMDQDDVSYPYRLEKQISALQSFAHIDLLATRAITIDQDNVVTGLFPYKSSHREICKSPWFGFYFPHPTWMGKIEWFRRYRYANPAPYLCEDQELLLRTYCASNFATLDEILFAYRVRQKVDPLKLKKTRRSLKAMQARHFLRARRLNYLLLSQLTFFCRGVVDLVKCSAPNWCKKSIVVDSIVLMEWRTVLTRLGRRTS